MLQVWKYTIMDKLGNTTPVHAIPSGATVVHVGTQNETICVWVELDPEHPRTDREFTVVGTGHVVPEGAAYVGTTTLLDGSFVGHVYEVVR